MDTCAKCDKLLAKIGIGKSEGDLNLLRDMENELSCHQRNADLAYDSKRHDKAFAATDSAVKVHIYF